MQWEYPTSDEEFTDPRAFGEPPEPVEDGLLLHAAASRARAAVAMMAAVIRAVGGHARRGRHMTQALLVIMSSKRRTVIVRRMSSGSPGADQWNRCPSGHHVLTFVELVIDLWRTRVEPGYMEQIETRAPLGI